MARPRKRKRAVSAQGTAQDEPESKKPKISQVYPGPPDGNFQSQHVVLNRFYPQVLTLRGYVLSKLPASSRIRRKKVTAVGLISKSPGRPVSDIEKSLGALLDNTLVGFTQEPKDVSEKRLEEWKNFSQKGDESYVTLSDGVSGYVESQYMILEYVIRALFAKEKRSTWPKHLLCEGFRKNGALGLRSVRPNHHVETIKQSPWPELLALLGESGDQIMIDLLIDCSIFVRVNAGANNFYQISGKPLSDIEALNGGKSREQRTPEDSKSPSEIIFVRNRMLYARAALNARGSVHFGLRHIHVLNRSPFTQIDGCEGQSDQNEQQKKERNSTHTTRILMYIFPRQFGLHNVFTSNVNLKETSQRLKDYTLREEEITEKFGRLSDPGVRVHLPKRLRGRATELCQKLQILHQRCSYAKLLQHYCPINTAQDATESTVTPASSKHARKPRSSQRMTTALTEAHASSSHKSQITPLVDLATPLARVSAFCQAVMKKIVPKGFWGDGRVADHNGDIFLKKVDQFISMRRFEGLSLHDVTQGMKITDIDWLAPAKLQNNKTSQTDVQKRIELFHEFIYFLVDSVLIPLIRGNFYVTESNTHKYRLFFFRHDIWRSLAEPAMASLKGKMFQEINLVDAHRVLDSRLLGFSQVRLLPKGTSMRPIMNLRRRAAVRGKSKELGPGINKILSPAHTVLQLEKAMNPKKLGSTMFSVGDIYKRIKPFKSRIGDKSDMLYFAKVDVKSAFDTIPQAAIISLLDSIPQQRDYRITKYLEVAPNLSSEAANGSAVRSKPLKKWPSAATSHHDVSTFLQLLEAGRARTNRNSVFVDLWKKQYETSELLQLVASHIQQNLVKIGKKFYRQKEGIPQGSVLSSTLCNYFYADLEIHVLPFLNSDDCLLMRLIDDFLLITTNKTKAVRFVETMHQGVPEYGVTVSSQKTLVNFDLEVHGQSVPRLRHGQKFPYCGTLIDCKTLDISRGSNRSKDTVIYDSLTVEFARTPGQTFQRKVLNSFKIQSHLMFFDTKLNSARATLRNIHEAFAETSTKMWAYARCLPVQKQPSSSLVIRTISKLIDVAYLLLTSKSRKLRYPDYVCDVKKCEVSWLAYTAFHQVLMQKQAKYGDVLAWLKAEMGKMRMLKDIRNGRVRLVASGA